MRVGAPLRHGARVNTSPACRRSLDLGAATAVAEDAAAVARALGRGDIVTRLASAAARSRRTVRIVAVVGQLGQGKSSLVNAILGRTTCPVDDDVARAVVTVLHHAEEPQVVAHRAGAEPEALPADALPGLLGERGDPAGTLGLARVDVGLPHPLLATGLTIVDTPGAAGPGAGSTAAVLGLLPFVDALLYVRDAASPLDAADLDLLRRAQDRRVPAIVCLTKADLHPGRAQASDEARRQLHDAGIDASVVTVSSALREQARHRGDHALDVASGVPKLLELLDWEVQRDAAARATGRLIRETDAVLAQLEAMVRSEIEVLVDTRKIARLAGEIERARVCLDHLSGAGSRWEASLADGIDEVAALTAAELRTRLDAARRAAEAEIRSASTAGEWLEAVRRAQDDLAGVVSDLFAMVDGRVAGLATALSGVVGEAMLPLNAVPTGSIDVRPAFRLEPPVAARAFELDAGISLPGGALTLGTLALLLPAATSGLLAAGPVVIGTGLLMGLRRDDGEERVAGERRDAVCAAVRQLVDDVQLQLGTHLDAVLRSGHRHLEAQVAARVEELARTRAHLNEALDAAVGTDDVGRRRRRAVLELVRTRLDECLAAAAALR